MLLRARLASARPTRSPPRSPSSRAPGDVIVLAGEMGAGKTAFAQGFGRALGVDRADHVADVHARAQLRHGGKLTLHHADLYRLDRTAEVADLALAELAEFDGIVLVEWGDVVASSLGDHLVVRLDAGRRRRRSARRHRDRRSGPVATLGDAAGTALVERRCEGWRC